MGKRRQSVDFRMSRIGGTVLEVRHAAHDVADRADGFERAVDPGIPSPFRAPGDIRGAEDRLPKALLADGERRRHQRREHRPRHMVCGERNEHPLVLVQEMERRWRDRAARKAPSRAPHERF